MDELINDILRDSGYTANPYFVALADGSFAKEDFVETQLQFHHAVVFFARPMASLAAKIPTHELRVEVLRNVWEEHGHGDLALGHGSTFKAFLERLGGVTPADVRRAVLWPEVRVFNTTLMGACVLDDYLVGCGLLGMIERMFADISAWIGQGVVRRGWIPAERIVHYTLHAELDVRHAQDFFDVLRPAWELGPTHRHDIEQGLQLGAAVFNRLYEDLWRHRGRRLRR